MTFEEELEQKLAAFADLESEALRLLDIALDGQFAIHSVEHRVKEASSVRRKMTEKGLPLDTLELDRLTDLLGLRVICFFRRDILPIAESLDPTFSVLEREDKNILNTQNGYQSYHVLARLPSNYRGERYDHLRRLVFEVQIRTIGMDAWAKLSHKLAYRNEFEVPPEYRAEFKALSGLYYVADSAFEVLADAQSAMLAKWKTGQEDLLHAPLSVDTLDAFIGIDEDLSPRAQPERLELSDLLNALAAGTRTTVGDAQELLARHMDEIVKYETGAGVLLTAVGALRVALALDEPTRFRAVYDKVKLITSD